VVSFEDTDNDGLFDNTEVTRFDLTVIGLNMHGLAYNTSNNTLYGIGEDGDVYSINKTTGATTFVADVDGAGSTAWTHSLAYDPAEDLLFAGGEAAEHMWSITAGGTVIDLGAVSGPVNRGDGLCPIPEPVTLSLLGLGGALMMVLRRRK